MDSHKKTQLVLASELSSRFRSKEDLHRYLTLQGNLIRDDLPIFLAGVFLPSLQRTSLDFLRDILREAKWHLKQKDVVHLDVPHFAELSVKSLYEDALADDTLKMYLPSKRQLSNKLPEREFFFGLVGTLKRHWL
jgi:hypothetical protein